MKHKPDTVVASEAAEMERLIAFSALVLLLRYSTYIGRLIDNG
jgi:hypothetical protein